MDEAEELLSEAQIKHMADRFLHWKLPDNFSPDNGVTFGPTSHQLGEYGKAHWPVGTNLFSAGQAAEMVRYMVEGLPRAESRPTPDREGVARIIDLPAFFDPPRGFEPGPEWSARRKKALSKADAILALARPASSAGGGLEEEHSAPVLRTSELASGGKPSLDEPYVPARAIHFEEPDILEWVARDVPVVASPVQAGCDVLLDMKTREPIGWRIYGWSKRAPAPSIPAGWVEKEERAHGVTIDQRDAAEEALSQAFYLVTGRSPKWSNVFGYPEALEEIGAALAAAPSPVVEGGDQGSKSCAGAPHE